jgi:putative MATE family efflux protein
LLTFALPMLGANALQSLNGSVNQFWVSHSLGEAAITAIGNANIVMMLMLGAVFGVGMAASILIGQSFGARNPDRVRRVMGTSVTFFVGLSIAVAAVGYPTSSTVLALMGTPQEAVADAEIYLRIVFLAMPFMYVFAFLQMALRGVGDSRMPFRFMVQAIVLDVVLNPLLINGVGPLPRLGIAGSALSTFIGQGVSLACLIIAMYRSGSLLALRPAEWRLLKPERAILTALVVRGLPIGLQILVMSGSAMAMIGFVNTQGSLTAAAFTAASQVWTYVQMPAMAIGGAVSAMAAQNIGAGRWDRVGRIARAGVISSLIITGSVAAVIYLLGDLSLRIFLPSGSQALPVALHINVQVLWGMVLFSVAFALSGVMRATGSVWGPLLVLFVAMYLVRVPFAGLLLPHLGADAIWWSFPLGTIASSALTTALYLHGGWKRSRMLSDRPATGSAPDAGMATPALDDDVPVSQTAI